MMIETDGIGLCVETFGRRDDPAMLLIGGAAASMDWWEDDFCRRLADGGHFVIRYDNRDTGQSTGSPAGAPDYTGRELTLDALRVLDGLGIERAHLVGISMGGSIAQEIAIEHPERVITLTVMATSPVASIPGLPPSDDRVKAFFDSSAAAPDWTDRAAFIRSFVDAERVFSGTIPVDEQRIRALAGRAFDRTRDPAASQTNHWIVVSGDDGSPPRDMRDIAAPTLVLHGTADPLFPFGHGEALAREIPDATLVPVEGMGHQMPPPETWDQIVGAILSRSGSTPD